MSGVGIRFGVSKGLLTPTLAELCNCVGDDFDCVPRRWILMSVDTDNNKLGRSDTLKIVTHSIQVKGKICNL